MAFNFSPKIVTDGLVLLLDAANTKSYIKDSTQWIDLSRSRYSGSLVNSPTFTYSGSGAIVFDGTNNYCQLTPLGLDYPLNITIVGSVPITSENGVLFSFSDPTSDNKSIGVGIIPSIQQVRGYYYSVSTGFVSVAFSNALYDTVYHASANFTTSGIDLYVNGTYTNTLNIAQTKQWTETAQSYNICRLNRPTTFYYGGNVHHASAYNKTLSPTEVLQNYNALKGRFNLN